MRDIILTSLTLIVAIVSLFLLFYKPSFTTVRIVRKIRLYFLIPICLLILIWISIDTIIAFNQNRDPHFSFWACLGLLYLLMSNLRSAFQTESIPEKGVYNIKMGFDARRNNVLTFTAKLLTKHLYLKNGDKILLDFPFDFPVGEVGETECRNVSSPIGNVSTILYQIINDNGTEQISLKVMDECLTGVLLQTDAGNNYFLDVKDSYQVSFLPESNLVICKPLLES